MQNIVLAAHRIWW